MFVAPSALHWVVTILLIVNMVHHLASVKLLSFGKF